MGKMSEMEITIEPSQARIYQLWAVGLHSWAWPAGEDGIRGLLPAIGSIQLDPLPVLGRNHDLVVQARVDGTHPGDLLRLVHGERIGFEYWDKVLCAISIGDFSMFRALMEAGGEPWERRREERIEQEHPGAIDSVYRAVAEVGPLSSRELRAMEIAQGEDRSWKSTRAANGALESLWNKGKLSVSHRVNYRRYFDLTERVIPQGLLEEVPPSYDGFIRFLLKRRVRMVGLLPARGDADAWAFLREARRARLPERLAEEDELCLVRVEGMKTTYYAATDIAEGLTKAEAADFHPIPRFIAPLDPLICSREATRRLWGFDYTWEVYKPAEKRKYGYYVLPVLYNDRFVGRFDGRYDPKTGILSVISYHEEPGGLPLANPLIQAVFERFLGYLGGERIELPNGGFLA
ncbi:hypothetical protein DRJ24_03785 [Candidatus Acetothermia bacterium]|nr:MAG: hypothetical protein DRJ24_03785 [Candidatus Acetothermia bacterium]HHK66903.1 winged helix-turn-helix domain-containing protein [Candidatus Acetothermia bacterium]